MKKILLLVMLVIFTGMAAYADEAVVAKVNGAAITAEDLEGYTNQLVPRATFHGNISKEKRDELRQKALDGLIDRELQYQDAVSKGMKPDKKEVNERMDKVRGQFASRKDYQKALKDAGITEDQFRARAEKAVLIDANIRKSVIEPAQMSDAALKDYYDKNAAKFKEPESVHIRIISTEEEKKIREALARVKAGQDFGDVAAAMSEDNYRVKGGDIGYVHKGRILTELEDAAFKMKTGAVSDPIKAEDKWFIIKVEDKKPEQQKTFDESKHKLKEDLENKRAAELKDKWLSDLHAKAKIEVLWKPAPAESTAVESQATGSAAH